MANKGKIWAVLDTKKGGLVKDEIGNPIVKRSKETAALVKRGERHLKIVQLVIKE